MVKLTVVSMQEVKYALNTPADMVSLKCAANSHMCTGSKSLACPSCKTEDIFELLQCMFSHITVIVQRP